jgi:uncharacterized surface protein with fasciclin (FAS1) repeats
MNDKTRVWVWGAVAVLVVLFGLWWWYAASTNGSASLGPAGYGAPAASSTSALEGPTANVVAENRSSSTVAGIISSLSAESRFAGMLTSTGVAASISGKGPYTVFVPTDASFGTLPTGTINNLSAAQLKRLVQYHIISGKKIDVNAQVAGTVQALSKDMLNFSKNTNDVSARVNSSVVIHAYKASNGIVYVISQVLLPPTTR